VLSLWTLLIVLGLGKANDDVSIRQQEITLASALRKADRATLLRVTESQLHVHLECVSAEKSFSADLNRESWIDTVTQIRVATYEAKIADIHLAVARIPAKATPNGSGSATLRIDETINIFTSSGNKIEKRLSAWDTWVKRDDTWKLLNRIYGPRTCDDGPRLQFP